MVYKQKIVVDVNGYHAGTETVFSKLGNTFNTDKESILHTMEKVGQIVLDNTIPITPMDTGDLRESAQMETFEKANSVGVTIGFGGGEVDYAQIVHNDLSPHNFTTPNTGPMYLYKGVQMSLKEIEEVIAADLKAMFKAGK